MVFSIPSFGQAIIGSDVGIPTLNQAIAQGTITVTNGVITQDIRVRGDLGIISLLDLTFDDVSIVLDIDSGTITITESRLTFLEGNILRGASIDVEESHLRMLGTNISETFSLQFLEESFFDCQLGTTIRDVDRIIVDNGASIEADDSTFDNTQFLGGENYPDFNFSRCSFINHSGFMIRLKSGRYYGDTNTFTDGDGHAIEANPTTGIVFIEEQNSTFTNHVFTAVTLVNVTEAILINNTFIGSERGNIRINSKNPAFGAVVEGNNITGGTGAITIFNHEDVIVRNNIIRGIESTFPFQTPAIRVTGAVRPQIIGNRISELTDANGLSVSGCNNPTITDNISDGGIINFEISECPNARLISNAGTNGIDANFFTETSDKIYFCSNIATNGNLGFEFSGKSFPMQFVSNRMTANNIGLLYNSDVITSAQIENGNQYFSNELGAAFINQNNFDIIDAARHEVRNNAVEFPTHSPNNWFLPTADNSAMCAVPQITFPSPDSVKIVKYLIRCATEPGPDDRPMLIHCINNTRRALEIIWDDMDLLLDFEIALFYANYSNSPWALFPNVEDVIEASETNFSIPPLEFEEEEGGINHEDYLNYLDAAIVEYNLKSAERQQRLNVLLNEVELINTSNVVEEDYKFAMIKLIELAKGLTLEEAENQRLITLASSCLETHGHSIYVARVAADMANLSYNRPDDCEQDDYDQEVESRSSSNQQDNNAYLEISPNPVSNQLSVNVSLSNKKVEIIDISGKKHVDVSVSSDNTIDVSQLKSGMYFITIEGHSGVYKFVKI